MPFGSYLEKYRSTLSSSQGRQLLKVLTQKREKGEIRTLDEFKAHMKALTKKLLENKIRPTLVLLQAVPGADTSSERYNNMLERIQDDLETAFEESNNIEEVIAAHHNLIEGVALKAIRYGINELESRITLYEFLEKNGMGFNHALYHTFAESERFTVGRSNEEAAVAFSDFRLGEAIGSEEDCLIDLVGERLSLGLEESSYLTMTVEWLPNTDSLRSELNVEFDNSNIANIIDGKQNTYWIESFLFSDLRPGGITAEFAFTMGASADVNFVDIEPAVEFPMELSRIDYIDGNKARQTAYDTPLVVQGPMRVNFSKISTNKLILRFTQKNYREVQFKLQDNLDNFHRAVLNQKNFSVDIPSVSKELRDACTSEFLLGTVIHADDPKDADMVRYYQYVIGFDNLRPGFNRYKDRGIFASVGQELIMPGQFALRVQEVRPTQEDGSTSIEGQNYSYPERSAVEDSRFYHSSAEYWLTVKAYSDSGLLLSTNTVPILPFGGSRVYHERLLLTHKSSETYNQGALCFFCDADSSDVIVYRNGTELTYSSHWDFVPESGTGSNSLLTQPYANTGLKMSRGIWITTTIASLDIFTVSYTPKVSNTRATEIEGQEVDKALFEIVDLTGDQFLRSYEDNLILMDSKKNGQIVSKVNAYLTVIMRRNSAVETFTPFVEEFMLLAATVDSKRFEGKL